MSGMGRELDERRQRILAHACEDVGVDAILLKLGENMLPLTGYWPGLWFSYALLFPTGEAVVFCPELDLKYASQGWAEVREFSCLTRGAPDPLGGAVSAMRDFSPTLRARLHRVGYEGGFDLVGPSHLALEQPAAAAALIGRVATEGLGAAE